MDLTELIDRALIAQTLHAYCVHVDDSDLEPLLGLFTPDAVIEMGQGILVTGRDDLRTLFIDRIGRWNTTNHYSSTITLRHYDRAAAAACSYVYAFHDSPERDRTMHLWGRYEDELVRAGERWLISRRRLLVAGVHENASADLPGRFQHYPRTPLPIG